MGATPMSLNLSAAPRQEKTVEWTSATHTGNQSLTPVPVLYCLSRKNRLPAGRVMVMLLVPLEVLMG
jgi:hypothetical protein